MLSRTGLLHSRCFASQAFAKAPVEVTLLPGTGIWPELFDHVQSVLAKVSAPLKFTEFASKYDSSVMVSDIAESLKKNGVGMKGDIGYQRHPGEAHSFNMELKRQLDLFAGVVHCKNLPGVKTRLSDIDIVIIREQLEGEYSCLEHESVPGVVESLKIITAKNSERIAKYAFDYAVHYGRKKVTAVHKANIMKLADGLFLNSCEKVSKLYPLINFEKMIVDNTCMQLVSNPQQFDVMVLPNLYGNIVDNLSVGLVGGAGCVPGESVSRDVTVFEPGSRHDYEEARGKDIANPTAALLMTVRLLRHLNFIELSEAIERSVKETLSSGKDLTPDLGGNASTSQFIKSVTAKL